MKKVRSILLLLLASTLLLPCCKKFEEDDEWIHLRTVKNRIEGLKEITMWNHGPTDLLPYWQDRFGDFYLDFTLNQYNPYKKGYGYKILVFEKGSNEKLCEGQWGFLSKEIVFFVFDCLGADTTTKYPYNIHGGTSTIVKLSNKDMWLRSEESWHSGLQKIVPKEIRFVEYKN